uniref:hypothetical protein n=1 Tax=Mitsuokella multacida TaxID=52226 RepID=UPI003FA32D60
RMGAFAFVEMTVTIVATKAFPAHGEGGSRRLTEEVHGLVCTPYLERMPSPLKKVPSLRGG